MRVSQKALYDTSRSRLGNITEELSKQNTIIASGKRLNNFADDPIGMKQVLSLKSNLSNLGQIKRNTAMGKTWLNANETTLSDVKDIISDAKALAVQMNNTTVNSQQRIVAAEQIRGYISQIEALANTRVHDQYIYSGTATDTKPYALDSQSNPSTATYSGNTTPFSIKTGKDTTVQVGYDGQTVFSSAFTTLIDFRNGLLGNDTAAIGSALDNLETDFDSINSTISEVGARVIRIETKENIIQDLDLSYTEYRAELEEADIIDAISKLKSTELAYQAALTSTSKLMTMSLIDYLR